MNIGRDNSISFYEKGEKPTLILCPVAGKDDINHKGEYAAKMEQKISPETSLIEIIDCLKKENEKALGTHPKERELYERSRHFTSNLLIA